MSDADVPRDPWGNPIPDGVRPPNRPPASQDPLPAPPAPSVPPVPPNWSPRTRAQTGDAQGDSNPAWPGRPAVAPPPPTAAPPSQASDSAWPPPPPAIDRPRVAGTAIASLVCGIASILCIGILGVVLGPTAIGLGLRSRRTISNSNGWRTGEGMATAGIVCGIIGTVIGIAYIIFLVKNPDFLTNFLDDLTTTTTARNLSGA